LVSNICRPVSAPICSSEFAEDLARAFSCPLLLICTEAAEVH
jgi:hypothetical protein